MLLHFRSWLFSLIENRDFWLGVTIWLFLVAPFEMLIHECGHIYVAQKYGIKCRYIRFGIGRLFKWKLKNGIIFYIGIPAAYVATRFTGDGADQERAKDDPQSFSYSKRHPKERVCVALAGPIAALGIAAGVFGFWLIIATILHLHTPFSPKLSLAYSGPTNSQTSPFRYASTKVPPRISNWC